MAANGRKVNKQNLFTLFKETNSQIMLIVNRDDSYKDLSDRQIVSNGDMCQIIELEFPIIMVNSSYVYSAPSDVAKETTIFSHVFPPGLTINSRNKIYSAPSFPRCLSVRYT